MHVTKFWSVEGAAAKIAIVGLDRTEANMRERLQRAHVALTRGYAVGLS